MIYYKGDIIEVLNLRKYEDEFISIGSRYIVVDHFAELVKFKNPKNTAKDLLRKDQTCLYKRPLKNKIISLVGKIRDGIK